jgi:hypothetical protein
MLFSNAREVAQCSVGGIKPLRRTQSQCSLNQSKIDIGLRSENLRVERGNDGLDVGGALARGTHKVDATKSLPPAATTYRTSPPMTHPQRALTWLWY